MLTQPCRGIFMQSGRRIFNNEVANTGQWAPGRAWRSHRAAAPAKAGGAIVGLDS